MTMKELSVSELKDLMDHGKDFLLIDVREQYEKDIANLGGELIPLGSIMSHSGSIPRDRIVIIYCRSGMRSAAAIRELEKAMGFTNLYNLRGGVLAWAAEIDSDMPTY